MRAISKEAQRTMERLIEGFEDDEYNARKIDNTNGTFMAVHVEQIGKDLFSIAHYGEQNGDLMKDPEIVYWRGPDKAFYPAQYFNDYLGTAQELIHFDEEGKVKSFAPRAQKSAATFTTQWFRNIRSQQKTEHGEKTCRR